MPTRSPIFRWIRDVQRRMPDMATGGIAAPDDVESPEPIYISQRTRTILILALILIVGLLAWKASNVVLLFLLGATLALVLSFPTRFLARFMSRGKAIVVVTLTMLLSSMIAIAIIVPFLIQEITQFGESFPDLVREGQSWAREGLQWLNKRGWIDANPDTVVKDMQKSVFSAAQNVVDDVVANVLRILSSSVGVLITTFGVLFVGIYLLTDIPKFRESYVRLWAPRYRNDAAVLWDAIGYSLSRYLAGLLVSIAFQGIAIAIGLALLGVPYAVVLGLLMAVTAIIPYVGAFLSGGPGVLVALTVSWETAVATLVLYLLVNQLDGNLLTPRIQGSAVRVHPLLIFFAVIAGSTLFGPFGAILAVPAMAIFRVVGEFFWLRLRVHQDEDTMLSLMRQDTVDERISNQTPLADDMHDDDVSPASMPPDA